ncbi:diaminopimelate decarboxylase [Burkholderiaceae bacterium DAT-1]|nr:diaminopimelate decarboxylase [Burkholderiaceae bacterium DAT-1]
MFSVPTASLAATARTIGSPFWIYDASVIRAQIARLRAFDTIRFAQKANSNLHILKLMRAEGVQVDAVSLGEIERALAAGFDPAGEHAPIVFTADIIDRATLARVKELNIPVNCGSLDMVEQIGRAAPGHPVWLRINPGYGHGHSRKTNTGGEFSKHGIWFEELKDAVGLIRQHGLKLVGLHMHIGSGVDYSHLQNVCASMVDLVKQLGMPIEAISAGGGLSIPYRAGDADVDTAHYFDLWDGARKEIEAYLGTPVRLEIEPGRFLVAQSGRLVAEVYAVKRAGSRCFVLVNAGFSDLARPAMYGSYHAMSFIDAQTGALVDGPLTPLAVAGPLCESGDVFTQADGGVVEFRELALPKIGDYLVIEDAGAYGASMSSNYNSRPLIPELLADQGHITVIREAQTIQQLLALEAGGRLLSL